MHTDRRLGTTSTFHVAAQLFSCSICFRNYRSHNTQQSTAQMFAYHPIVPNFADGNWKSKFLSVTIVVFMPVYMFASCFIRAVRKRERRSLCTRVCVLSTLLSLSRAYQEKADILWHILCKTRGNVYYLIGNAWLLAARYNLFYHCATRNNEENEGTQLKHKG